MRRRGAGTFAILAVFGLAGPVIAIGLLSSRIGETPLVVAPDPIAEETMVVTRTVVEERTVEAALSGSAPVTLVAGAGSGGEVTTDVMIDTGDEIGEGATLLAVDGVARLAAITPQPFYRELRSGSSGPDVQALQEWLVRLGYLDAEDVDGSYGGQTGTAVQEMNRDRGVSRPTRTFIPASVIWVPRQGLEVGEVKVEVGAPAPSSGDEILTSSRVFDEAAVRLPNGEPVELDGPWDIVIDHVVVGEIVDDEVSPEAIEAIASARPATDAADESEGEDPDTAVVTMTVRRQDAASRNIVSAGSVVTVVATEETSCVFVQDGDGYAPFPTEVVGGDFGVLYIDPAPRGDAVILANPIEFLDVDGCG